MNQLTEDVYWELQNEPRHGETAKGLCVRLKATLENVEKSLKELSNNNKVACSNGVWRALPVSAD